MELLEEGSELLVDRGSVTFLTLTSSVTCPRLAGAFKFFATGPYLAVGVFVYLLADGFGAARCAPSATRSRASSRVQGVRWGLLPGSSSFKFTFAGGVLRVRPRSSRSSSRKEGRRAADTTHQRKAGRGQVFNNLMDDRAEDTHS